MNYYMNTLSLSSDSARIVVKQLMESLRPYIEPIMKTAEGYHDDIVVNVNLLLTTYGNYQ